MADGQVAAPAPAAFEEMPQAPGQEAPKEVVGQVAEPSVDAAPAQSVAAASKAGQVDDEADEESDEDTQAQGVPSRPPDGKGQALNPDGQVGSGLLPTDSFAIVPALTAVAVRPKRGGRSAKPEGGYEGQCWFECGETASLINIGNARSVRLCCCSCNNSRRAFDSQARMQGEEAKAILADLKKNRQAEYKDRIRQARVVGTNDKRGAGLRRQAANNFLTQIQVTKGISEVIPVYWMNKAEFVGHQITRLGHSRADGEAMWAREVANPRREKRGSGPDLRLAVCGVPKTEVRVGVDMTRSLTQSIEVDFTGRDGEARLSQISDSLAPAALPDLATSEVFSAVDRSGLAFGAAASSSGSGANPLGHLSMGSSGRTYCGDLARTPAPLLAIAGDQGTPSRATRRLQGQASEPDALARATSKVEAQQVARTVLHIGCGLLKKVFGGDCVVHHLLLGPQLCRW